MNIYICATCGHEQSTVGECEKCPGYAELANSKPARIAALKREIPADSVASKTPRTDAAEVTRACINGAPNSGADSGAVGFDRIVTVEYARKLEVALQFYANPENWHPLGLAVAKDGGAVARNALDGMLVEPGRVTDASESTLQARIQKLESYLDKTADGKLVCECEKLYCPHCGSQVREGGAFCCYCDECVNPDDGCWPHESPLPLGYGLCLAEPKTRTTAGSPT